MEFWQGKKCPVCDKPFTENDDIVCCPDCGTVHHRACWEKTGQCFYTREHAEGNFDTANPVIENPAYGAPAGADEYSEQQSHERITCRNCGYKNPPVFRVCSNCGADLTAQDDYPPPPDAGTDGQDRTQSVEREDLAQFCRNYGEEQLNSLESAGHGNTVFHVPAFFFSFFWLLYRKVINWGLALAGAVALPLVTLVSIVSVKSSDAILAFYNTSFATTDEYTQAITALSAAILNENYLAFNICFILFFVIIVAEMLFCGFYGLKIYRKKAISDIKLIKQRCPDPAQRSFYMAARGGTSFVLPVMAVMLLFFISSVITNLCIMLL